MSELQNKELRCSVDNLCHDNQRCRQWGQGEHCVCETDRETCEREQVEFFECETSSHNCLARVECRFRDHMFKCTNMTSEMAQAETILETVEEVGEVVGEIFGDTFADMGTDIGAAFGDVLAGDVDLADLPIPKKIDIWKVISVQLSNYTIMTNIEWEDTYMDYYDRKSVRIQTLLARVIGKLFDAAAREHPEDFGEFEFIGVEVAGWEKDEISTNLAIKMYGSFTYVKKIDLMQSDLSTLGSELDFSWMDATAEKLTRVIHNKTVEWTDTNNLPFEALEFNELILVLNNYTWTSDVFGFDEFKSRNDQLKSEIKSQGKVPEMLAYVKECSSCYVLPIKPVVFAEDFVMPPQEPMMNSLSGVGASIDLCKAKDKKLFVQINAKGKPPFQGTGKWSRCQLTTFSSLVISDFIVIL